MAWVSQLIAVLLTVGMTIPAWAMRDCCCARKAAMSTLSCCAKRSATPAPALKKCCAARAKAAPSATVSINSDHACLCLLKSSSSQTTNPSRRVTINPESPPLVWDIPTNAMLASFPPRQNDVVADLPPPMSESRQVRLCRWLM
ncbi:MAG: hypothetical protein Q8K78_02695 [Planctomycetaceae bacterium]|nr:hypothetical protein [Planctomycetaceae bacterium]